MSTQKPQALMNDPTVFPPASGGAFPEHFPELIAPWCRRFFRLYCHFYRHHLEQMEELKVGRFSLTKQISFFHVFL